VKNAAPHYVNEYVQACPLLQMVRSLWLRGHGQSAAYAKLTKQDHLLQT